MLQGTAASTNAVYAPRQRKFADYCALRGIGPLPASELILLDYVGTLHSSGLSLGTCSGHLSAIRHLHVINGHPDPLVGGERLALVKRGASVNVSPPVLRAAITGCHIFAFLEHLNLYVYEDVAFYAMCCTGFFGFLRIAELTAPSSGFVPATCLTPSDLLWADDKIILTLKQSKTDKKREGVRVTLGISPSAVCAFKALKLYLDMRASLLPHLHPARSPLFVTQDGAPMSKAIFAKRLADLAALVGLLGKITPHSLRIGAATTAWRAGFTDSQIQKLGRWKSTSFKQYLRTDTDSLAKLNALLGKQCT